jgi:hypothetical protein
MNRFDEFVNEEMIVQKINKKLDKIRDQGDLVAKKVYLKKRN